MYLSHLSPETAQRIADGIMKIIPYNINIMDKDGIIIASGDKSRINTVHKGALKALEMGEPYIVYEDTLTERKGINLPINYNNHIVGVIGISGNVDEVMQIGQIVVVTAQLMIENTVYHDMTAIKESRLKDFLHEWIYMDQSKYSVEFLKQANYFGIDLSIPRTAVIITINRIRFSVIENISRKLEPNEYIVRQSIEYILILFVENRNLESRLEQILNLSKDLLSCYVGEPSLIASETTDYAEQTYQIAQKLGIRRRIIRFREVSLECHLNSIADTHELATIAEILESKDKDGVLQETICAYVENNYDHKKICEELHIHRNTLNYRLTKIHEMIGKNPRHARDLMLLYIAVIKRQYSKL